MVYIDRCVCTQRTFRSLVEEARTLGVAIEQVIAEAGAGAHCTTCRPYLERCAKTGETEFFEILRDPKSEPPGP